MKLSNPSQANNFYKQIKNPGCDSLFFFFYIPQSFCAKSFACLFGFWKNKIHCISKYQLNKKQNEKKTKLNERVVVF